MTIGEIELIEAILTRPATITAVGITVTHRNPTLALCRKLVEIGYPDDEMTVTDAKTGKPVLLVSSIHAAAKLTVVENERTGPRFGKFEPFDRSRIDARGTGSARTSRETELVGVGEGEGK